MGFDNVEILESSDTPSVVISEPIAYSVYPDGPLDLQVSAVAINAPTDATVEFFVDGFSCGEPTSYDDGQPGKFTSTCASVQPGEHIVEAILLDHQGEEIAFDQNQAVGVGGSNVMAVGDSLTNGVGDNVKWDNISLDWRTIAFQGWASVLGDLQADATGNPTIVSNEGIPGDTSADAANQRVTSIIERNPLAEKAIVLLGTNDSNPYPESVPSGSGCDEDIPGDCDNTYKGNMVEIARTIAPSGSNNEVVIPLIPPAFGNTVNGTPYSDPLNGERNLNIQEYNDVIAYELAVVENVVLGPDLFSCFLSTDTNRFSLFSDNLHFNALGHKVVAHLLSDSLLGAGVLPGEPCPAPIFILESLSPPNYKQNLLEVGNKVYVDEPFVLTSYPFELDSGRWVMTANADYNVIEEEFISFDLGSTMATVYVAYQTGATPPAWLTTGYDLTNPLLQVFLDAAGSQTTFDLYQKVNATGVITLGGNMAAGSGSVQYNYVAIVVEE